MYQLSIVVLLAALAVGILSFPGLESSTAHRLVSWKKGYQNMWELGNKTEGDMDLRPEQINGSMNSSYKWKNNVLPYQLSPVFSKKEAKIIDTAVKAFKSTYCLSVKKRDGERDFVYVTAEKTGCWANVGRWRGNQTINLQIDGCLTDQIIIHEFLHAAGFYHQHSSNDRDKYISVNLANVNKTERVYFDKYDRGIIANLSTPYDYGSIMHYSERAFSKNGNSTIVPKNSAWIGKLGTATKMSAVDIKKLKKLYCNNEPNLLYSYVYTYEYVAIGVAVLVCLAILIAIYKREWYSVKCLGRVLTYTLCILCIAKDNKS